MENNQKQEKRSKSSSKSIVIISVVGVAIIYSLSSYLFNLLDIVLSFLFPFG